MNQNSKSSKMSVRAQETHLQKLCLELINRVGQTLRTVGDLQNTQLDPEQLEYCDSITLDTYAQLLGLTDFMNEVMDPQDQRLPHSDPLDLANIIRESINVLSTKAYEKGIVLNCQMDPDLPFDLYGDPNKLRHVIINLLHNMVELHEVDEILITVSPFYEDELMATIDFSITVIENNFMYDPAKNSLEPLMRRAASHPENFEKIQLRFQNATALIRQMGGRVLQASEDESRPLDFRLDFEKPTPEEIEATQVYWTIKGDLSRYLS